MSKSVPVFRQINWIAFIPNFILLWIFVTVYEQLEFENSYLLGISSFFILFFGLKFIIARDHHKGMKLIKIQQYEKAISFFENSVSFFDKNNWIDKFRFITLLSSSKMTYKEMGLCNIAFCYGQIGNGKKAKEYYEQVLKEFPENSLAIASLKLIDSIKTDREN